jgi:hypothetical protein
MRDKRTANLKIHVPPPLKDMLAQLSASDARSISTYCARVLEEHATLKITLQKIEGTRRGS